MWWHMYQGGPGYFMGGFNMLLSWGFIIWLIIFTILVVIKLDRIIQLIDKK